MLLNVEEPDLVLICETWCNSDVTNAMLNVPGYFIEPDLRVGRKDGSGPSCLARTRLVTTCLIQTHLIHTCLVTPCLDNNLPYKQLALKTH